VADYQCLCAEGMPERCPCNLIRWAEMYGSPEEWAKKAQQLHADNEKLRDALMAAAPLAEVPGTPEVVAQKLRGIVSNALRPDV